MDTKKSFKRLDYYKGILKIENSILTQLLPLFLKNIFYKTKKELVYIYPIIILVLKYIVFGLLTNFIIKDNHVNTNNFYLYSVVLFLSIFWVKNQFKINNIIYTLKNDHFYRLLGDQKYELLKYIIVKNINYDFINWILPLTYFYFLELTIERGNLFILIDYLLFMLLAYFIFVISTILNKYILEYKIKKFVILDKLYVFFSYILYSNILASLIYLFLFIINNGLKISISSINDIPNLVLYLSSIYLLLINFILFFLEIYFINNFIKTKLIHIVTNPHFTLKRKITMNKIQNENFIQKVLLWRCTDTEKLIIKKDWLMVIRGNKKSIITFWMYSFYSILFGFIFVILSFSKEFPISALILVSVILTNILILIIILRIYSLKRFTWYSSEKNNNTIFLKLYIDLYKIYNAKKRLNILIALPLYLIYLIISGISIFSFNINYITCYLFMIIYMYLTFTIMIKFILFIDIKKPKLSYCSNWIGDPNYLFIYGFIFIIIIPFGIIENIFTNSFIEINNILWKMVLLGMLSLLILIKIIIHLLSKKLKSQIDRRVFYDSI